MSECYQDSMRCSAEDLRQALSIHTKKITDSCRDKDCIEDLRVYLTRRSQAVLDSAAGAKVRCADLLYAYIDVEPVAFDRCHYCIDVTFFYRILADTACGTGRPTPLQGLAVFSKRAVLCGEDSRTHIFTSDTHICGADGLSRYTANHPTAVVEVLDPMILCSKIKEADPCGCDAVTVSVPEAVKCMFDEPLVISGGTRQLFVTLGQFSIVRLERDAQLVVPVLDYAVPCKECCDAPGGSEDPCEMFSRIPFPTEQFSSNSCDADPDSGYQTC